MKKNLLLILAAVLLFSCNQSDTNTPAKSDSPVKPVPVTQTATPQKIKIDNNGVNIEYDDTQTGDTTLLFVHGWGINKTYWTDQTAFFSKRYRVVAVDLPGFGTSGKNRTNWSVQEYAKDITAVLTKLDLKKVILIGHSMSGAIVLEAAIMNPDRVLNIVGVDNFKSVGTTLTPEEKEKMAAVYNEIRANFTASVTSYANEGLFAPTTDPAIKKRVLNDMLSGDSTIAVDCMEYNDKYALEPKLITLNKTLYLVNSDFVATDTKGFRRLKIPFQIFNVGKTGHYPMLENPAKFNALLQQAIDKMK